jgi:hypothetical protein
MREVDLTIASGAIFSDDRKYRYILWRIWNPNRPIMGQNCLNPSKAGEFNNDPTITRGMVRADKNGFGGFVMTNLFGLVSTDPKALLNNPSAVGEFTDYYISQMVEITQIQLCGWGSFKPVSLRCDIVYPMLSNPYCLGTNNDGQPKHPLYVGYDVPMIKYRKTNLG